jgi:glutamate N-acetyltransferase/amino-acid N-acetyltransferase
MTAQIPQGYRMAAVHCGLKRDAAKEDFALIVSDRPATAAGVYTLNQVCAAPVTLDRARTPGEGFRVVAVNSGCANACTGDEGTRNAAAMARLAAAAIDADEQTALVLSTGIIGEQLAMNKIETGVRAAAERLADGPEALLEAARGMMTTDLVHKVAGRELTLDGRKIQITGLAKGSGMIGPNMATMLGVLLTDAALDPQAAQDVLRAATDVSFNCVSVDGHTSTNDTVLLLANGAAGGAPLGAGEALEQFRAAVTEVCIELAKKIADDGEGATHLITIEIEGCRAEAEARRIAKTIAESPLAKTAVAGADPNWGRIVSAAGYAGVPFRPEGVTLRVNDHLLYERGRPVKFDAEQVSRSIRDHRDTHIVLRFSEGEAAARFWTCDLTTEYVHINADYHT